MKMKLHFDIYISSDFHMRANKCYYFVNIHVYVTFYVKYSRSRVYIYSGSIHKRSGTYKKHVLYVTHSSTFHYLKRITIWLDFFFFGFDLFMGFFTYASSTEHHFYFLFFNWSISSMDFVGVLDHFYWATYIIQWSTVCACKYSIHICKTLMLSCVSSQCATLLRID